MVEIQGDAASTPASRAESDSGYPLLAVLHLTTVTAVLLGCVGPSAIEALANGISDDINALAGLVAIAMGGTLVGIAVGWGAVRRLQACLIGAAVGAVTALIVLGIVASASPLRVMFAIPVTLAVPIALRARHA